jgi:hypothetical protein
MATDSSKIEILSLPQTSQDTASWLSDPNLPWLNSPSPQPQQQQRHQQPNQSQELSPRLDRPVSVSDQSPPPALTIKTTLAINNNTNVSNGLTSPITRLPVDLLLYIASLRFLTLNDIVQWRATASVFYNSIPLPNAAMVIT